MNTDTWFANWFRSRSGNGPQWLLPCLLALLLCVLTLGGDNWRLALEYQRAGLARGQLWRLLSGHLVHLGVAHLLFNLAGLLVLWLLYGNEWRARRWLQIIGLSMLAIDAGLWLLAPQVQWYVGASGVLHGVWVAGAWAQLRRRDALATLSMLLLIVKLAWEQGHGGSVVLGQLPVVVEAHLYGTVGGLAGAWALARWGRPL